MRDPGAADAEYPKPRCAGVLPAPEYGALRARGPVRVRLPAGNHSWLLTRHKDVREGLAEPRTSADSSNPDLPRVGPLAAGPPRCPSWRRHWSSASRRPTTTTPSTPGRTGSTSPGDARGHLAFGHGVHQCLGRSPASLELEVAPAGLFGRFPGLRLAVDFSGLRFRGPDSFVFGVHELPVAW